MCADASATCPRTIPSTARCACANISSSAPALKGVRSKRVGERVDRVIEQCGLTEVRGRIISQLSKGYRQRVGLADALVHEPELVILDEPTIGLDPSQIRSVRQLIKDLGREHTVLVSTHILSEVEMTCNRVLIMREGRILAADSPDHLLRTMSKGGQTIIEIAAPRDEIITCWEQMPEIDNYDVSASDGDYFRCVLTAADGQDLRPILFDLTCRRGWKLRELSRTRHSLEDVYIRLTRPETEEEVF